MERGPGLGTREVSTVTHFVYIVTANFVRDLKLALESCLNATTAMVWVDFVVGVRRANEVKARSRYSGLA